MSLVIVRSEKLDELHQHLLPTSNILMNLEKKMGYPLSVAQAMVIIKDQISVNKLTMMKSISLL